LMYSGAGWGNNDISHNNLLDKGTNSHSQIDSFISSKGQNSGICPINSSGKIDSQYIPNLALTSVTVVSLFSEIAALLPNLENGDVIKVSSTNEAYIVSGGSVVSISGSQIDNHLNLSNIGVNSHSQIDSHIADNTKHFIINDSGTSLTETWSANKTNSTISTTFNNMSLLTSSSALFSINGKLANLASTSTVIWDNGQVATSPSDYFISVPANCQILSLVVKYLHTSVFSVTSPNSMSFNVYKLAANTGPLITSATSVLSVTFDSSHNGTFPNVINDISSSPINLSIGESLGFASLRNGNGAAFTQTNFDICFSIIMRLSSLVPVPSSISQISDVQLTSLQNNNILQWNGTKWINVPVPSTTFATTAEINTGSLNNVSISPFGLSQSTSKLNNIGSVVTSGEDLVFGGNVFGSGALKRLTSSGLVSLTNNTNDININVVNPTINSLANVVISNIQDQQSIKYDSFTGNFINYTPTSGGASNLDGLSDVAITSNIYGQFLFSNGANDWINKTPVWSKGGGTIDIFKSKSDLTNLVYKGVSAGSNISITNDVNNDFYTIAGTTAMSTLTDSAISGLTNAQQLRWNSTSSKWENFTSTAFDRNVSPILLGLNAGLTNPHITSTYIGVDSGKSTNNASGNVCIGEKTIETGRAAGGSNGNVAIGANALQTTPGNSNIAIGAYAGNNNLGAANILIGSQTGQSLTGNFNTVVGMASLLTGASTGNCILGPAIGFNGNITGNNGTYMGYYTASRGTAGDNIVAIGAFVGYGVTNSLEANSVSIGAYSGYNKCHAGSMILNAGGVALNSQVANATYMNPIRSDAGNYSMKYNTSTKEVTYDTAKTFVIEHPIHEDKYLVHATLEGPENGIYYRGIAEIKGETKTPDGYIQHKSVTVKLPDYVSYIGYDFTIQLTSINQFNEYYYTEIEENEFKIFSKKSGKISWTVIGKRSELKTEPDKLSHKLNRNGPYTWLSKGSRSDVILGTQKEYVDEFI